MLHFSATVWSDCVDEDELSTIWSYWLYLLLMIAYRKSFSRKDGEGSSAKTLALLHKLDTHSHMTCHVMSCHVISRLALLHKLET